MNGREYKQVSVTVIVIAFFAMALCAVTPPSFAQAPGWSRGQQLLSITYEECVSRAKLALQAENYRIDHAAGNFAVGVKEVHTAVITCNPVADAKEVVNIVVVSNGEGGGSQRQRLQAQMERATPTPITQPPGPITPQPERQPQPPVSTGLQTCVTTSLEGLSDKRGQRLSCTCPPGNNAWVIEGTDIYRHNSDICVAAVHAGLITFQNGGTVTIEVLRDDAPNFRGSERNGVKSYGSQYSHLAFRFMSGANVAAFQKVKPQVEELPEDEIELREDEPTDDDPVSPKQEPAPGGQHWILESVTNNLQTWGKTFTTIGESSAHMDLGRDKADFQWTAPPQRIDSNGFTVSMSIQVSPGPGAVLAAEIHVHPGTGVDSDTPVDQRTLYVTGRNGSPASGQQSVKLKPNPNASELEVNVGFNWGPNFKYKYRRAE